MPGSVGFLRAVPVLDGFALFEVSWRAGEGDEEDHDECGHGEQELNARVIVFPLRHCVEDSTGGAL